VALKKADDFCCGAYFLEVIFDDFLIFF